MTKKLLSFFMLVCFMFSLTSCVKDKKDNKENEKEEHEQEKTQLVTVKKGMANLKEVNNYRFEVLLSATTTEPDTDKIEFGFKVEMKDNAQKMQITFNEEVYTLYLLNELDENNESVQYIIINSNLFVPGTDSNIKATIEELITAIFGETVKPPVAGGGEQVPSTKEQLEEVMKEFGDFFNDLKDEYFDLNDENVYVFNEKGKEVIRNIFDKFIVATEGDSSIKEEIDIKSNLEVQTNDKYITKVNASVEFSNPNGDEKININMTASVDKIQEVLFELPENTITIDEFIKQLESTQPEIVY